MPGYPADTVSGTTDPTAPGRDYPARGGYQGSGYDEGIVSEETGYPTDLLDMDLDLEADLGIDTVKQAEVFASIRESYDIPFDTP